MSVRNSYPKEAIQTNWIKPHIVVVGFTLTISHTYIWIQHTHTCSIVYCQRNGEKKEIIIKKTSTT